MSEGIKASTADEYRFNSYRAQTQAHHDAELRELEAKNSQELQRLQENHKELVAQVKGAYEVEISHDVEALDEHLHDIRMANQARVETEKKAGEEELTKVKKANQQKIAEYKKNSEHQIGELRKETQASMENLHAKAKQSARAQGVKGEDV